MDAIFKPTNPQDIVLTLELTATVKEWDALYAALREACESTRPPKGDAPFAKEPVYPPSVRAAVEFAKKVQVMGESARERLVTDKVNNGWSAQPVPPPEPPPPSPELVALADVVSQVRAGRVVTPIGGGEGAVQSSEVWERAQALAAQLLAKGEG